jgi:hypothetical protein
VLDAQQNGDRVAAWPRASGSKYRGYLLASDGFDGLLGMVDRLNALAELDAAGTALYSDQRAIDSIAPMGRAMIQMVLVFGEQERQIRS